MTTNDLIGCIAAIFVLATFCTKRMVQLRTLALISNIAFVAYAYRTGLFPILLLHMSMLPVNAVRLHQELMALRPEMVSRMAWRPWA